MNQQEHLSYFLLLSKIKGIGYVRFNQILLKNEQLNISMKDFFHTFPEIEKNYPFIKNYSKGEILSFKDHIEDEKRTLEVLQTKSIKVVTILDQNYPYSLKQSLDLSTPPILYTMGNQHLFAEKQIAVVGTRVPSIEAKRITQETSNLLTEKNIVVTSGYAKGVDKIAHHTALNSDGKTILVIGCGFLYFPKAEHLFKSYSEDNILIMSEFHPDFGWHKGQLMTRNKTICGLSESVIVVESRENGGSYRTGSFSLMLNKPLYAIAYPKQTDHNSGNFKLIENGAHSLIYEGEQSIIEQLETVTENMASRKYENNINQFSLFDELREKIKSYLETKKPFPVLMENEYFS